MSLAKLNVDFSTCGTFSLTSSSQTVVIPVNTEMLGISTTGNTHFRLTSAALATAVSTDPMLTPNSEIQVFKINDQQTNLSVILDATSTGAQTLSWFRVFEA